MSDHVKRPDLMRCRTLQGLMMLLFFATSSIEILHAEESKQQPPTLLDQIWPYEMPHKRPLSKQDQEYAEAALMQWVEAYLHHEYEVVDERFFGMIGKNQNGAR